MIFVCYELKSFVDFVETWIVFHDCFLSHFHHSNLKYRHDLELR